MDGLKKNKHFLLLGFQEFVPEQLAVKQQLNLATQLYRKSTEFDLSRMLKLATAGPIPLNDKRVQQWPKTGDQANLVLIEASCSAKAVSRISPIKSLIHKGTIVYKMLYL